MSCLVVFYLVLFAFVLSFVLSGLVSCLCLAAFVLPPSLYLSLPCLCRVVFVHLPCLGLGVDVGLGLSLDFWFWSWSCLCRGLGLVSVVVLVLVFAWPSSWSFSQPKKSIFGKAVSFLFLAFHWIENKKQEKTPNHNKANKPPHSSLLSSLLSRQDKTKAMQ